MLSKTLVFAAIVAITPAIGLAAKSPCPVETPESLSVSSKGTQAARLCLAGRAVELRYSPTKRTITIKRNGKQAVIARIDKGFTPDLIGSTAYIRFLPTDLQPYGSRGIVLLNTVERSTGGDGRGQCGSGEEIYIEAVDVARAVPKPLGRILVHSCHQPVVLYGTDDGAKDYSSFSVRDGKLAIKFLSFGDHRDHPTAVLSDDFRSIEVINQSP
jgi:hypothetical protein